MKQLGLSLTLTILLSAGAATAQNKKDIPPFRSSENLEYVAKKSDPLIGLIKSDTFQGVVLRPDSGLESLRLIDDHLIPGPKVMKLDEKICRQSVQRVLGSEEGEDPAIKIGKIEIFESRFGDACEVEASDLKSDTGPLKRYRSVIGLYKGEVRAFVAQDKSPVAREGESAELRAFLKSLK